MKIVKMGKVPDEMERQKTCYNCKTVFSYIPSDTQTDRDGKYVICPVCGKFIHVI